MTIFYYKISLLQIAESINFFVAFKCTEKNGLDLREPWHDGAESFYGIYTKHFPNLFQ